MAEWQVESLARLFSFRNPTEVVGFLRKHPFLIDLLEKVHPEVQKHFGPNPKIFLEVVIDPEATDDRQLFAFIQTTLSVEEANKRLEQLDEDWWLDAMDGAKGKLCIDIEFA